MNQQNERILFDPDRLPVGPSRRLRTKAWISYVFWQSGWDWEDLERRFRKFRGPSALVDNWRLNKCDVARVSAKKLIEDVPGSLELFDLPLWELLKCKKLRKRTVRAAIREFIDGNSNQYPYRFPKLLSTCDRRHSLLPTNIFDSKTLGQRGDIYALTALLAIVRECEFLGRDDDHAYHMANLIRGLPNFCDVPFLNGYEDLLIQAVKLLRFRVPASHRAYKVRWSVVQTQIDSKYFEAVEELRMFDIETMTFAKHEDPIVPALDADEYSRIASAKSCAGGRYEFCPEGRGNSTQFAPRGQGESSAIMASLLLYLSESWGLHCENYQEVLRYDSAEYASRAPAERPVPSEADFEKALYLWSVHKRLCRVFKTTIELREWLGRPLRSGGSRTALEIIMAGQAKEALQTLR